MKIIGLAICFLGISAMPALADVSDPGNLTIGGQAVIGGTMTVQASAFSVGGSTFSVAGGSITLGGRLNAAATGIKWADGTTSTTAAGGGGGDVTTAGDNAFTGSNTEAGELTMLVGSTMSFTTTDTRADYRITLTGHPVVRGQWTRVISTDVTSVSSITFCGFELSQSKWVRVEYDLIQNTYDSQIYIRFNDDPGNHYYWTTGQCHYSGCSASSSYGTSECYLEESPTYGLESECARFGEFTLGIQPGNATRILMRGNSIVEQTPSDTRPAAHFPSCVYQGSAPLRCFMIRDTQGTMTGTINVSIMR